MKFLVLLAAFSLNAFAGESYGCDYLMTGLNTVYPGLSRPEVLVEEAQATVTLWVEGTRGESARRTFILPATQNWYADGAGNLLQWLDGRIVLHLLQLRTYCSP